MSSRTDGGLDRRKEGFKVDSQVGPSSLGQGWGAEANDVITSPTVTLSSFPQPLILCNKYVCLHEP